MISRIQKFYKLYLLILPYFLHFAFNWSLVSDMSLSLCFETCYLKPNLFKYINYKVIQVLKKYLILYKSPQIFQY